MTRRMIVAALALFAFLALESCGVSRLAGPVNNDARTFASTQTQFKKKTNKPTPVIQESAPVAGAPAVPTTEDPIERSH